MSELNNIRHLCASPLTFKTTRYKRTTSLRSTPIRHFFDMHVSRVSFAQQIHSTVNRETSDNITDNSVPSQREAPAATSSAPSQDAAGAAIPEAGPCGFDWEDIS
jgi:hypothetical protein